MRVRSFTTASGRRRTGFHDTAASMTRPARTLSPPPTSNDALRSGQVWAYALAIWPLCIGQQAMIFAGPYFARHYGLPLAALGLAMTGGRIFDAFADIGVANASDRLRTPFGRRR